MIIHNADSLELLATLKANTVDSLVTDPPAGISFMGKSWDNDRGGRDEWIAWMTKVMKECFRVMKPGAHGLVWALPRTSHWTATALENAGFEVRDIVTHLFGTGFPKSLDISKAIDKQAGAEREVVGFNANHRSLIQTNTMVGEPHSGDGSITAPSTEAAKQWQGFGTALKPACEMWVLIRKPCSEKTVAANVLKHGTGGLNIDASRIGLCEHGEDPRLGGNGQWHIKRDQSKSTVSLPPMTMSSHVQGRFPSNLVFSHTLFCTDKACDEACAVRMLDEQSGHLHGAGNRRTRKPGEGNDSASIFGVEAGAPTVLYDRGGVASRFFYCAKASKSERNAGLEGMPEKECGIGDDRPSGQSMSRLDGRDPRKAQNTHPTVKSLRLMEYLIRMITPPNGTVLDPFMGSGSTGVAAKSLGFQFIGIEKEKEYFEIAERRIG